MKWILFSLAIINSVASVANNNEDHISDKEGSSYLRLARGSDIQATAATSLFEGALESDFDYSLLDEESELLLKSMDEVNRKIQLAAYVDYTQNNMSMEAINEKYDHGNLDAGFVLHSCCLEAHSEGCYTKCFGGAGQKCNKSGGKLACLGTSNGNYCVWTGIMIRQCCAYHMRGKKGGFGKHVEECKRNIEIF